MESILSFLVNKIWPFIKREFIGFFIGISLTTVVLYWYYWEPINNYYNLGNYVGKYDIKKGEEKVIAVSELSIQFSEYIYGNRNRDTSVIEYPYFEIFFNGKHSYPEPIVRMPLNEVFFFDAKYYYYAIEFIHLNENNFDTTATFIIHRREYPSNKQ